MNLRHHAVGSASPHCRACNKQKRAGKAGTYTKSKGVLCSGEWDGILALGSRRPEPGRLSYSLDKATEATRGRKRKGLNFVYS